MAVDFGHPVAIGVTTTKELSTSKLVGFLATGTGAINISKRSEADGSIIPIVTGAAVTSGEWIDLPFIINGNILIIETTAAAEGVVVIR